MNKKIDLVLLAGGYAGSLRPITEFMPKAMLFLGNKPLIHHILEDVSSKSNLNKIFIFVNYFKEIIIGYVNLLRKANLLKEEIIFIETDLEEFNTAGALLKLKNIVTDQFILYYSDVLPIAMNYSDLINSHFENNPDKLTIGTLATSNYYELETGYVEVDSSNYITNFIEKPCTDEKIKNMAIGVFESEIINHISKKSDNFFRDVIPNLLKNGYKLKNYTHNNKWYHFQHVNKYHSEHVKNYSKWISESSK